MLRSGFRRALMLAVALSLFVVGAPSAGARAGTLSTGRHMRGSPSFPAMGIVNPLLRQEVRAILRASARRGRSAPRMTMIRLVVSSTRDVTGKIRALGGTVEADIGGHILAAAIPANRVSNLASMPFVRSLYPDRKLHLALDTSIPEIRANQAWKLTDTAGLPVRGKHVIVGIVDSGIDYKNPDFRNADGTARIKYIWDQTTDGNPPAGFTFGYQCDATAVESGACPERDTDGHGTHVAGIAAGNGLSSSPPHEIGVAPQADILVVKSDLDLGHIISAWKYLIDTAKRLGEPIVINNSFGSQIGPHDGSEMDSQALDALSGPGHIFVAAAGNQGNQGMHTDGEVSPGGKATIEVDAHGGFQNLTFGVFYSPKDVLTATLTNASTGEIFGPASLNGTIDAQLSVDGHTKVSVDASAWDDQHRSVLVNLDTSASQADVVGQWDLTLSGQTVVDSGRYDAWMDTGQDHRQAFANPDESDTVAHPGDAHSVITVGNYATRVDWSDVNGVSHTVCDYTPCFGGIQRLGDIASHSSVGPTADGRQKPDISAPGVLIFSSLSADAPRCSTTTSDPCIDPMFITPDGKNYIASGTSMSSPHVTGVVALMLQVDPALDPTAADGILRATARHDQFTGNAAWSPTFGAGKVDAYASVRAAMALPKARPTVTPTATPAPTPTGTPVKPDFAIVSVRVDKQGHDIYSNLQNPALKWVRSGRTIELSIYTNFKHLPDGTRIESQWTVHRGRSRVFVYSQRQTEDHTFTGILWSHARFTPRQPGVYAFAGAVIVNGSRQNGSTAFRVFRRRRASIAIS